MLKQKNLIFVGAPGAGTGTFSALLLERHPMAHISTGDILRDEVKRDTELGREAAKLMKEGKLVPDEVIAGMVRERLAQPDCDNGFILDGFPRTVAQAEALEKMGVNIDKVVEIHVADEAITARMSGRRVCEKCGNSYHIEYKPTKVEGICDACGGKDVQRDDDKHETVISRLKTYHEKTAPLKDFYAARGKLVTVEGQQEIADTSRLTLAAVKG